MCCGSDQENFINIARLVARLSILGTPDDVSRHSSVTAHSKAPGRRERTEMYTRFSQTCSLLSLQIRHRSTGAQNMPNVNLKESQAVHESRQHSTVNKK